MTVSSNNPRKEHSSIRAAEDRLTQEQFDLIRKLIFDAAGITIADHKQQLVHNRISKRLKDLGLPSFDAYIQYVMSDRKTDEMGNLINALTTNVTHFFRENHHFEQLREHVLQQNSNITGPVKIWSAGCSIGAEPYSIAMKLVDLTSIRTKILATDIDTKALNYARDAIYSAHKVKGLDDTIVQKFFKPERKSGEDAYLLKQSIRNRVSFNYFNLNDKSWPMAGPFHHIFCRNVLIYFNRDKQREFLTKMVNLLAPEGYLYLGHSEHSAMDDFDLKIVGQTIYQKTSEGA